MTELVRDHADQFFVVEMGECVGTDDENVSAAGEGIQFVGLVDRKDEATARGSRRRKNHARCGVEPSLFVTIGSAHTEQAHDEDSLGEGHEHHDRCERGDDHEGCVRRVERERGGKPDQ